MSDTIDRHKLPRITALVANGAGGWLLPAAASALLHGLAILVLLGDWWPQAPSGATTPRLQTQLLTLSPVVAPEPAPPPPEVKPAVVEQPAAEQPAADRAAIARKRLEEQEQEHQRQQERRRQEEQQLAEQRARQEEQRAEQQRAEQQRAEARQAEQQRLEAAARARAQAEAAAMAQYQPIDKAPPVYPRRALEKRTEGDCTVSYTVAADGRVIKPQVVEGACDDPIFIRPSLEAARAFRYQPRIVNGQAVAVHDVRNTFRYRIQ